MRVHTDTREYESVRDFERRMLQWCAPGDWVDGEGVQPCLRVVVFLLHHTGVNDINHAGHCDGCLSDVGGNDDAAAALWRRCKYACLPAQQVTGSRVARGTVMIIS